MFLNLIIKKLTQYHESSTMVKSIGRRAPPGCRTVGDGGYHCETVGAGGRPEGREYRGGIGNGGTQGYVSALPPAPALMVMGQEDMEHDLGGEGGEALYRLHPGDG